VISQIISEIEGMLTEAVALQGPYVTALCPLCPDPCCARVHYLFTEKDILFLRLSGRKQRWRKEAFKKKGCWFLDAGGCVLDPLSRPFICHRYICKDLEETMKEDDPERLVTLQENFRLISEMRSRLWSAYLEERMNDPSF
jgi:hypothetical protein